MADNNANRNMLTDEVLVQPLRAFQLFAKLPLELRREIWHATFPARNPLLLTRGNLETLSYPPPITAWINQESRTEPLLFYSVIECYVEWVRPPPAYYNFNNIRPLYTFWNPKMNVLILDDSWIMGRYTFQSRLEPFLDPNTTEESDNISMIKRLELRITPRDWECRHYRSYMSPTCNRCASLLQMFSSLQELSIRIRAKENGSKILRAQAKENKLEKFFEECLPERAKENSSSNVPEVVVLVE